LRSIEPSLCGQILKKHEEWQREQLTTLRSLIEREIEAVEMVSLRQLCTRAGLSLSLVRSQCTDLKKRYEQKYCSFRAMQRSQRDEVFRREVKVAVMNLLEFGDYPSAQRVFLLNPSFRHAGWAKIQRAIEAAIDSKQSFEN
jgi:hypothetical protein